LPSQLRELSRRPGLSLLGTAAMRSDLCSRVIVCTQSLIFGANRHADSLEPIRITPFWL
jgi:hypothetical protein